MSDRGSFAVLACHDNEGLTVLATANTEGGKLHIPEGAVRIVASEILDQLIGQSRTHLALFWLFSDGRSSDFE